MFNGTYKTISAEAEGLFRDKGSRFIGLAFPVKSETEVKKILMEIKKKYYDATHHCYAYYIGHIGNPSVRMNDDGEPSGTAGRPIYGQILSSELKDVLVVVVRYFGGTKLGVSKLMNAYKETAKITINNAKIEEKKIKDMYTIEFKHSQMNEVMQVLKNNSVEIETISYLHDNVMITCNVVWAKKEEILGRLRTIYGIKQVYIATI